MNCPERARYLPLQSKRSDEYNEGRQSAGL